MTAGATSTIDAATSALPSTAATSTTALPPAESARPARPHPPRSPVQCRTGPSPARTCRGAGRGFPAARDGQHWRHAPAPLPPFPRRVARRTDAARVARGRPRRQLVARVPRQRRAQRERHDRSRPHAGAPRVDHRPRPGGVRPAGGVRRPGDRRDRERHGVRTRRARRTRDVARARRHAGHERRGPGGLRQHRSARHHLDRGRRHVAPRSVRRRGDPGREQGDPPSTLRARRCSPATG